MAEPSLDRLHEIARRHSPPGWKIIWRTPKSATGQFLHNECGWAKGVTDWDHRVIENVHIIDRMTFGVFLHECGHVNMGHDVDDYVEEYAQCEYEAESYAISAMRAAGIKVPRLYVTKARAYVDWCIRQHPVVTQTDEVLKFAYGSKWRDYR